MPIPPNTTSGTAITITSLPYSVTASAYDSGGGLTYDLWYKYTATAFDTVVGAFGYGTPAPYSPIIRIYDSDLNSLLAIFAENRPVQFPTTPGAVYYVLFDKNGTAAVNASVAIDIQAAPSEAAPAGTILVNDDTIGFPLALLSSTVDYSVLRFITPFPSGEGGDVLTTNGRMLFEDMNAGTVNLYDASFGLVATAAVDVNGKRIRTKQNTSEFYCGGAEAGAPFRAQITIVSGDGVAGTVYTLPNAGLTCQAATNDGLFVYVSGQGVASGTLIVHKFDVGAGTIASFIGATANEIVHDLLVLDDDSLLVLYRNSSTRDVTLKKFDSAGVELDSVVLNTDTSTTTGRLAYALDHPASVWAWTHGYGTGISYFYNVQCSDLSILTTRQHAEYEIGAYQPAVTSSPLGRFGNSYSCPFLILRTGSAGGGGGNNDGLSGMNIETRRIRWLRRAPHLCEEQGRMFHKRLQLDMNVGNGLTTGQGVDPQVMVRWSDDGGFTWSNSHRASTGARGQYKTRVQWFRLGLARDRVYEFSGSDPVPTAIVDGYLDVEQGLS